MRRTVAGFACAAALALVPGPFGCRDSRDDEIARLRSELEKSRARAEWRQALAEEALSRCKLELQLELELRRDPPGCFERLNPDHLMLVVP